MAVPGRLAKEQFGYSVPVDAPLYHPFPVHYQQARLLLYQYQTDCDAVAELLPAALEVPDVAVAQLLFAEYPWSTVGAYQEVAQAVVCSYQNREVLYAIRFHVSTSEAMAAGREIGGFPKKTGHIEFDYSEMYSSHLERPAGLRICTGVFSPGQPLGNPVSISKEYVSLRVIPNPLDARQPSLAQLIGSTWVLGPGEMWGGVGSCHLSGASELDPYHKLPVLKLLSSVLYLGPMAISAITFVEDL